MTPTIESSCDTREVLNGLLDEIDGDLTSRSRVIDGLLDLRNATPNESAMKLRIDEVLADVPGVTTVANAWWLETLEEFSELA